MQLQRIPQALAHILYVVSVVIIVDITLLSNEEITVRHDVEITPCHHVDFTNVVQIT